MSSMFLSPSGVPIVTGITGNNTQGRTFEDLDILNVLMTQAQEDLRRTRTINYIKISNLQRQLDSRLKTQSLRNRCMLLLKAGATIFSGIYDKSKRKKSKCIPTSVNSKSPTNPSSINDFVEGSVIEAFVNSKLCAVKVIRSFGEGSYQQIKVPILFP